MKETSRKSRERGRLKTKGERLDKSAEESNVILIAMETQ